MPPSAPRESGPPGRGAAARARQPADAPSARTRAARCRPHPILLPGVLAALLAATPPAARALWPFPRAQESEPGELGRQAAELLARAIRIDTTNPPGNERPLARLFVESLAARGVEARLVETPSDLPRRRAAAWARLPGSGAARPVVLLSHLDVVPADPAAWSVPPFEGRIEQGAVIGRGALDAKGVSVVHLLALAELARRPEPLSRDVIFLATPDEESGGVGGAGYVVRHRPDLLHDAEFVLTEGGGILVSPEHPPVWGVTVTEKAPCWMEVTARGRSGHSATAPRDAATHRLVAALERVRRLDTELRVVPEVARMFRTLAPLAEPVDRRAFAHLASALEQDAAFRGRFLADPGRAALVRNTLAITVLEGSPRTNVLAAEATAHLDGRILPGERCEDFVDLVRATVADPRVAVEPLLSFSNSASPADTALVRAIGRVAREMDPEAVVVPRVIAGFTDAHYFREIGIASYGFVPRWLTPEDTRGVHGTDERISIANLERGVRALVRILEVLAGEPSPARR